MTETLTSPNVIVARQPIFDWNLSVCAYELLFRPSSNHLESTVNADSGDIATTRVINHAFMEIGMARVIGDYIGFVNLTRNFILTDDPLPFAQDRVVLEILEDIAIDDEVITAVKRLVSQGYRIALDDFIFHEDLRPLIEVAEIIKVDILSMDETMLREHVALLKQYEVKLLAEKVETNEQYELCRSLGFDFFQGYFFCRPTIIEDKPIPENHLKLLQIIQKLQDPDVEFDEIEKLISQDAGLSYKLLRLLNSAAIGLSNRIDSVRQALVFLGLKAIKTWTTLIALNEINAVPPELMTMALIRAKMCEKLAREYDCSPESGFLVGLFSNLDAVMTRPMEQLLKGIPLNSEIMLALTNHGGQLGQMLDDVINYQNGDWHLIQTQTPSLETFSHCYIEATEWTTLAQVAM